MPATLLLLLLQVASVELLDSSSMQPLPEYLNQPADPTWQLAPDNSVLSIWLPRGGSAGAWQGNPCPGVDIVVGLQVGATHTLG